MSEKTPTTVWAANAGTLYLAFAAGDLTALEKEIMLAKALPKNSFSILRAPWRGSMV